jgi:hypothetical protein
VPGTEANMNNAPTFGSRRTIRKWRVVTFVPVPGTRVTTTEVREVNLVGSAGSVVCLPGLAEGYA